MTSSAPPPAAATSPRRASALLRDPLFGTIFWGKTAVGLGIWAHNTAAAILAFQLTGSALVVGLVNAAQFAPQVLLSPLMGKWSDRGHTLALVALGRALCGLGSGGLATFLLLFPDSDPTLALLISSLLIGVGFTVSGPALQAIVPSLINDGEMTVAMRLNTAPMTLSRALGPVLGAAMLLTLPVPVVFAAAAATHLGFMGAIIRRRSGYGAAMPPPAPANRVNDSIMLTLNLVRRDGRLLVPLLAITAVCVGTEPASTLAPALGASLALEQAFTGIAISCFGAGAFAWVLIGSAAERLHWALGSSSFGLGMIICSLVSLATLAHPALALAAFFLMGVGLTATMTAASTGIQENVPGSHRGRVMALWAIAFVGLRPPTALMEGWLADTYSVAVALLATAVPVLAVAIVTLISERKWRSLYLRSTQLRTLPAATSEWPERHLEG